MKKNSTRVVVAVGIDNGDTYSQVCGRERNGDVVLERRVRTTEAGFRAVMGKLPPCRVLIEAGSMTRWIKTLLEGLGHQVKVADPRKLRRIYENENKSDVEDARQLSEEALDRWDRLREVRLRSQEAQERLAVLKARDELVRLRTALVNLARSVLKQDGVMVKKCVPEAFFKNAEPLVPEGLKAALGPVLCQVEALSGQIRSYDRWVAEKAKSEPAVRLLQGVCSVGPITAAAYVWTLDNPDRFPRSRVVGAFLGLRPRRDQSGEMDRQLPITKAGNSFLRRLLTQCAQHILGRFGTDTAIRRWGLRLAERGGKRAKRKAVVAVARKLAVILHRLWVTGAVYERFPGTAVRAAA